MTPLSVTSWVKHVLPVMSAAALLLACLAPVSAQPLDEVWRNKSVRILVPTVPGGDRALYTLPVAQVLGRHLPGSPTVVPVFMPGAGGALAVNNVATVAAADGLTIATPLAPVAIAQATGDASVKYDVRKLAWIGRTADANRVLVIWHTVPIRTIDDLKTRSVVVGTTGRASETWINPAIMNALIGTRFKMVQGYKGTGDLNIAMEKGETEGVFTTWSNIANNHPDWVREGKVRILLQIGLSRHPDLKDVPLLSEIAGGDEARAVIEFMSSSSQMGQSFAGPPGLPAPILAALRKAFDATMRDKEFLDIAARTKLQINPMGGAELAQVVARSIGMPPPIIRRYQAALESQ